MTAEDEERQHLLSERPSGTAPPEGATTLESTFGATMATAAPDRATARAIRESVASRRISPGEVIEGVLARAQAIEPELRSLLCTTADRARAAADELERELAAGREPGPLCGVPFTVKDTIWAEGVPTSVGSLLFRDAVAPEDALCVQRMIGAGAILVGKTNMPEFAALPRTVNRLGPECVNPHDASRVAGGSSGGAAAGVAAGIVPIALGTDAGGSNRIPAAYCGCVGVAPTLGRIPHRGGYRSTPWVTVTGPLTGSVGDAAATMTVLSQPSSEDPLAMVAPFPDVEAATRDQAARVRWLSRSGIDERTDPRVVALAERACRARWPDLSEGGDLASPALLDGFLLMLNTGRLVQTRPYLDDPDTRRLMSSEVVAQLESVRLASATDHAAAVDGRLAAAAQLHRLLEEHDVLATPTVAFLAPARSEPTVLAPAIEFTFLASYAGFPSINVPVGMIDGLPVGVQLIARPGDDPILTHRAGELEQRLSPCETVGDRGGP